MAGIKMEIAGDGNSFKVIDACTSDSTQCASTWGAVFGNMAKQDESSFELTPSYLENIEEPEIAGDVDIQGTASDE